MGDGPGHRPHLRATGGGHDRGPRRQAPGRRGGRGRGSHGDGRPPVLGGRPGMGRRRGPPPRRPAALGRRGGGGGRGRLDPVGRPASPQPHRRRGAHLLRGRGGPVGAGPQLHPGDPGPRPFGRQPLGAVVRTPGGQDRVPGGVDRARGAGQPQQPPLRLGPPRHSDDRPPGQDRREAVRRALYKEGSNAGELATALVPDQRLLKAMHSKLGFRR